MEKKNGIFWIIGAVLLFVLQVSIVANFILLGLLASVASVSDANVFEERLYDGKIGVDRKVAVIDLAGIISYGVPGTSGRSMVEDIIEQLKQARKDKEIAAIVLNIDSPGGEITASDTLFEEIKRCDAEKPVIAYINSLGASGAYYAALGSREIFANELSITGSIGVLLQTVNYEKLIDFIGVKAITFKSGKMKDILNPTRPMTEEERAYIQKMIDESYGKFLGLVAERRKLDEQKLRNGIADGRIVSGKAALEEGLIDGVGYLRDAIDQAKRIAELKEKAPIVRYIAPFRLERLLKILGKTSEAKLKVQLGSEFKLEPGKLYYISSHLFL